MQEVVEKTEDGLGFYDELETANDAAIAQADLIEAYGQVLNEMSTQMGDILGKYGDDQQKRRFDEIGEMLTEKSNLMENIVNDMKAIVDSHASSFENVLLMLDEFRNDEDEEGIHILRRSLHEAANSMSDFLNEAIAGKETTEKIPRATGAHPVLTGHSA